MDIDNIPSDMRAMYENGGGASVLDGPQAPVTPVQTGGEERASGVNRQRAGRTVTMQMRCSAELAGLVDGARVTSDEDGNVVIIERSSIIQAAVCDYYRRTFPERYRELKAAGRLPVEFSMKRPGGRK